MAYKYEFRINGVVRRTEIAHFRQNIIAEIVRDLNTISSEYESVEFIVKKGTTRYDNGKIIFE